MSLGPAELLAEARRLVRDGEHVRDGAWARSAAFLARQALERSVREYLIRHHRLVGEPPFRAQFLAARVYLGDDLAQRAAWSWTQLSEATHHHAYELAPTADELLGWMGVVGEVVERGAREGT